MPSALLFILLGVMWAVVLVPMWLRKHDEANESRSVDRFSRALRSLSSGRQDRDEQDAYDTVVVESRGRVPSPRDVMMPGRPASAQGVHVTVSGATGARQPRRPASAATRRRRVVLALLLVAAALLTGGLLHRVPVWLVALPLIVVVVVLIGARRQASRRAEIARRRRTREHLGAAARLAQAEHERQAPVRRGSREIMPGPGERVVDSPGGVGVDEALVGPELADDAWHAVPTTLPTYVTAPAATAVPRVIDRATPGGLSGAAMVEQARRTRQAEADESGMRVESFEISVSRPAARHTQDYAEQYVDTSAGAAELDGLVADADEISALVEDPRSGVGRLGFRRAAG